VQGIDSSTAPVRTSRGAIPLLKGAFLARATGLVRSTRTRAFASFGGMVIMDLAWVLVTALGLGGGAAARKQWELKKDVFTILLFL
jgi:hypothetical protein